MSWRSADGRRRGGRGFPSRWARDPSLSCSRERRRRIFPSSFGMVPVGVKQRPGHIVPMMTPVPSSCASNKATTGKQWQHLMFGISGHEVSRSLALSQNFHFPSLWKKVRRYTWSMYAPSPVTSPGRAFLHLQPSLTESPRGRTQRKEHSASWGVSPAEHPHRRTGLSPNHGPLHPRDE